jgi:hypothetical protein
MDPLSATALIIGTLSAACNCYESLYASLPYCQYFHCLTFYFSSLYLCLRCFPKATFTTSSLLTSIVSVYATGHDSTASSSNNSTALSQSITSPKNLLHSFIPTALPLTVAIDTRYSTMQLETFNALLSIVFIGCLSEETDYRIYMGIDLEALILLRSFLDCLGYRL